VNVAEADGIVVDAARVLLEHGARVDAKET
jgi:hypothetical protein